MCRQATCKKCGNVTWAGCGQHVEQVMGSVPEARRCHCGASRVTDAAFGTAKPPAKRWRPWSRA